MNWRRTALVARDEFGLTMRRPMTWTLLVMLVLLSWGLSTGNVGIVLGSGDASVGGKKALLTSEFALTQVLAIFPFAIYSFFLSAAAGLGIIRDEESRILELFNATPLRPSEYAWGKFLGVMSAYLSVLVLHLLMLMFFLQVLPNSAMLETRGAFRLLNYLKPALLFAVPSLLFYGGVTFGIGASTRRGALVFVVPIVVTVFSGVFLWSWSPAWLSESMNRLLMMSDPGGLRWLRETWLEVDRGAAFYNEQPVALDGVIIANRLLWSLIGIATAMLGVARHVARSRTSHVVPAAQVTAALDEASRRPPPELLLAPPTPLSTLGMRGGRSPFLATLLAAARAEGRELASRAGLYLFVPFIILEIVTTSLTALGAFDTPLLNTPGQLAINELQAMAIYVVLLLVFYGVESMERERAARLDTLQDSYPHATGAVLAGKLLALALVWLVIAGAALIASAIIVLVQGRVPFALTPFAVVWGLLFLPTFLAFTSFVFAAWCVAGNRYTAYAISLAAFALTMWGEITKKLTWVSNWTLTSGIAWSDMGAFQFDRSALVLNRLFWLSMAGVFWAIAVRWYPRRARDGVRSPLIAGRRTVNALVRHALPVMVLPLALGTTLWMRIDDGPDGSRAEKAKKDYWKRNLATWRGSRPAWLASADLDVDIDPIALTWTVKGSYVVRNPRDSVIRELPVTVGDFHGLKWTLDGKAVTPDTASHLHVFTLERPMRLDDSVRIGFSYSGDVSSPTKRGGGAGEFITPSGVVMTSFGPTWFPLLGYVESIGSDEDNRYEQRRYPDDWYVGETSSLFGSARPSVVRMRITVPKDFVANGVGEQVANVVQGDRRTVTWQSDQPVMAFNIVAGRLTEMRGQGTALYYHASHRYNVDEMLDGMNNARRWYGEWFGAYPWKTLKISEFPGLATYAQGFPTNISFSENIGFLTKSEPRTYLAFLVTAHESAHQWWGNMLQPGAGPGANILSEGLAHFSTALLLEQVKGTRAGIEFRQRIETRYAEGRRADAERNLYRIDGEKDGDGTVTYDKGGFVFWMMTDLMGRDRALPGFRDFITKFRSGTDHAALQDLTAHMRGYAPDTVAYDAFVRQWFDSVVVPEYRVEDASVKRLQGSAGWETTITVKNVGTGKMPVDVGVTRGERFPESEKKDSTARYEQAKGTVLLGAGERQVLRVQSSFEPQKVVVDPDVRVLQLRRKLAEREVKATGK